jgi:hypothetical protein
MDEGESAAPVPLTAQVGAHIRVVAEPNMSKLGRIAAMLPAPQALGHGLLTRAAEIEFDSGERAFVPWENLELID